MIGGKQPMPPGLADLTNVKPYRQNKDAPVPPPGSPVIPDDVAEDPVMLEEWHRLTKIVSDMKILSEADYAAIGLYCRQYVLARAARAILKVEGLTVDGHRGYKAPHPMIKVEAEATKLMLKILECYGMMPSSRARLSVQVTPKGVALAPFTSRNKPKGRAYREA